MLWWHWSILGLLLLGLEVLTLGGLGNFYFLFFGVAALIVSVLSGAGLVEAPWLQWVLFSVIGVALLFALRSQLQPKQSPDGKGDPIVDTLIGEVATVLEDLPVEGAGKAELRGSTWTARNGGQGPLVKGQRAQVLRVDGLTLWLHAEPPMEEGRHAG
jgi:membrane protein implicated in regulation of membrane protease activity